MIVLENTVDKPMDVCVLVGSLRRLRSTGCWRNALISLAPSSLKFGIVEIGQLPFLGRDDSIARSACAASAGERGIRV
jgi:chromate reductase, NAD(P)H dehydrogenase (quinone)